MTYKQTSFSADPKEIKKRRHINYNRLFRFDEAAKLFYSQHPK